MILSLYCYRFFSVFLNTCAQFCFVFQVSWFGSKSVSTAWTPQTFPFNENLTNLAPSLSRGISSSSYWLLCLVSCANSFTCHFYYTYYRNNRYLRCNIKKNSKFLIKYEIISSIYIILSSNLKKNNKKTYK